MNGIWTYSHLLPSIADDFKLSMGEGNTPLVKSRNIGRSLGLESLYFKLENTNPSGSYKDRFAASAVSHLLKNNSAFCLATSSGNTGAALAAYSAFARIPCLLAIVDGAPEGKLQQMRVYGANTFMVKDFGKDMEVTKQVMDTLRLLAEENLSSVQISAYRYAPDGMTGVQTIAYELAEALPYEEMVVFVPAGGGGLTLAILKGFEAWSSYASKPERAKINCVQPTGNDTIATQLAEGEQNAKAIENSSTAISGLQVPNVIDGDEVVMGCRATGGSGYAVTDDEVFEWQHQLAIKEGIYCEPAGAVALAGVALAARHGQIDTKQDVVCIVSGHGFKDPVSTARMAAKINNNRLDDVATIRAYIMQSIQIEKPK